MCCESTIPAIREEDDMRAEHVDPPETETNCVASGACRHMEDEERDISREHGHNVCAQTHDCDVSCLKLSHCLDLDKQGIESVVVYLDETRGRREAL